MEVSASGSTKKDVPATVTEDVKETSKKVVEAPAETKTPLAKTAVSKVMTPKNQSGAKGTPASVR